MSRRSAPVLTLAVRLSPGDAPPHAERDLGRAEGACCSRWALNTARWPGWVEVRKPLLLRATVAWTLVGAILYLALPLLAPGVLLLSVAAPLCLATDGRVRAAVAPASAPIIALILASASTNATWSLSPSSARVSLVMLFLFTAAVHLIAQGRRHDADASARDGPRSLRGDGAGRCGPCIEALSGQWLRQLTMVAPASTRTCGGTS